MIILPIILMLAMDLLWIGFINVKRYKKMVFDVQGSELNINIYGAIFTYLVMVIGLFTIVLPAAKNDTNKNNLYKALRYGALFGFCVYAIFNGTNYAIFKNYNLLTAFMDTLWGSFLYFVITFLILQLS